jgi:hypothetical protein
LRERIEFQNEERVLGILGEGHKTALIPQLPLTEFANVRKNFSHCKFSSPSRGEEVNAYYHLLFDIFVIVIEKKLMHLPCMIYDDVIGEY